STPVLSIRFGYSVLDRFILLCLFIDYYTTDLDLHSFPTRRSSDLPDEPGPLSDGDTVDFGVLLPGLAESAPHNIADDAQMFAARSEEHTSELQSRVDLVCRLLLEKKKARLKYRRE